MADLTQSSIRLGLMPPLTGLASLYGPEITWAGQIACAEVNAAGGVAGRSLALVIEDDGSLPETALQAAQRLLDQHGCVALIGNLLSNARVAVSSQVAEPRQVPHLNFSFHDGSLRGRYSFNFAALPNQQIDHMIPYMAGAIGPKMFFAGSHHEWPRASIGAAMTTLRKLGGDVVGEEYRLIGSTRIDELLERVQRSGADVFVPYFASEDQIKLLTRFTRRGLKSRMAVVMGQYDAAMAARLPPEVREGFYASSTYFMTLDTPVNRRYLDALAALPDVDGIWPNGRGMLTNFGEAAYLCVHAFAQAANQAGSLAPEALVAALEQVRIEGPQGRVRMDPKTHHAHLNSYLSRCGFDGSFSILESFGCNPPVIPKRDRARRPASPLDDAQLRPATEETASTRIGSAVVGVDGHGRIETQDIATEHILAMVDVAVLAVNPAGIIAKANRRASEIFGYQVEELLGLSVHELVPPQSRDRHARHLGEFLKGAPGERRMGMRNEITGYRKDGSLFPAEASISKVMADGEWLLVATLHDVTDRKLAESELIWNASHDALTGLPNRAMIHERLTAGLLRSKKLGHGIALLFIDLDGFKLINDTHGHATGDGLLRAIAQRLIDHVRPGDTVARLGGDEFVILCDQVDHPTSIIGLAERVNDVLREPLDVLGHRLFATASIGVAMGHGTTHGADDLLRNADAAMYRAKDQGRDGWRLFNQEIHDQARQRLDITNGLRRAIENDELQVRFQPILCTESQVIRGAELLLRWFSAAGEISPAHFIPIAEMSGSIIPIGKWVFRQACLAEAQWRARLGEQAPYVSVNVSARQLNDESLIETFEAMLTETGADPERILLELTETSLMSDVTSNLSLLHRLAELGLRVAVDDFGTGYSSLSQLLRLPVSTIKIDREFVDGLDKRHDSRAIVSAVCSMAHAMRLEVIAEGVETLSQFGYLRDLGCDYVQGYHFFRPLASDTFLATLLAAGASDRATAPDDLYTVLYVSVAKDPLMSQDELQALLDFARAFNRAQGITGFLLYLNGSFMQIIEGSRPRIERLLERIREDGRHHSLRVVFEGAVSKRTFVDWSMGFRDMDHVDQGYDFKSWRARTMNFLDMSEDARVCYNFISAFAR